MSKNSGAKRIPVGQVITIGKGLRLQFEDPPRLIVGIAGNVRESGLANQESVMYISQSQVPEGAGQQRDTAVVGHPDRDRTHADAGGC